MKIPKPYCKPVLPKYYFDLVEERGGVNLVACCYDGSLAKIPVLRINPDGTLARLPMSFTSADALGLAIAAGAYTYIDLVDEYRAEKLNASGE